jgi:RNA polymerase sigma-70 factor (ECF subfamily)
MTRLDEHLVAGYLAGDEHCFVQLIERYQEPLMRFLRDRIGDHGLAEDTLQEVFLTAALTLDTLVRPERFRSWLYTIASRKGTVMRNRRKREPQPALDPGAVESSTGVEPSLVHEPAVREKLRRTMARMRGDDRALLDLRFIDGFSHAEIAEILGGTESGIRMKLWRLKRALLRLLGGAGAEPA